MWTSNVMMARVAKHTNQFFGRGQIGPDRFWSRRRTFLMTSHLFGRPRNCYALAVRQGEIVCYIFLIFYFLSSGTTSPPWSSP